MNTLQEIFLSRIKDSGDDIYIHYKKERTEPFCSITYRVFAERVRSFAVSLQQLGISNGERVLISAESSPEWIISDFALINIGAISVPVFPTLTAKQVEYILIDCGAVATIVSTEYQLRKIINALDSLPALHTVIVMDSQVSLPDHSRVRFFHFNDLEKGSPEGVLEKTNANPEDTVTIIYTSGTTGNPKGVMLTHRNLISNVFAALEAIPQLSSSDIFLSFLPLSHAFERIASYLIFATGCQVAYAESIDSIAENMLEIRPTVMTAVPRFFDRLSGRIERSRDSLSPTRKKLFDWALKVGKENAKRIERKPVSISTLLQFRIADKLVLSKIRARTGGKIRFFVSGGAALNPELGRTFAAFGLNVLEGYGLTETSPIVAVNKLNTLEWGTVGPPLPGVEVKIADDGEILIRGANVMKGYYNDLKETSEMIDSDGWLHSGDIGVINENGSLKITDRKKSIIVLANGKNISPASIETLLESSYLIDQAVVIGESRDHCSALIVGNREALIGKDQEQIQKTIDAEIQKINRGLASFEKIRKFIIIQEPFTIENGMMTPTLKIRRKEVEKRYCEAINSLYGDL